MNKLTASVLLPLRFGWAMMSSGVQTVAVIVQHGLSVGTQPAAGFVRIGFPPMSARGAALLGCMISLTPGTTVIDIDLERREMVLHMLNVGAAPAAIDTIRRNFEPPLQAWFGVPL